MMSERNDGKSISEVVGLYMGKVITFIMRVFSVVLLVMVGVNFSVGPAGLLAKLTPDMLGTMFWLVVIMVYYLIATFLPIDKIIGKLYPVFGICLIIMALGTVFAGLCSSCWAPTRTLWMTPGCTCGSTLEERCSCFCTTPSTASTTPRGTAKRR